MTIQPIRQTCVVSANDFDPVPAALIYRHTLLQRSETFIAAQAYALTRYEPVFTGREWITNTLLNRAQSVVAHDGPFARVSKGVHTLKGSFPASFIRKLRLLKPAILHTHFGIDAISSWTIARRLSIPHVVTFHGYDATITDDHLLAGPRAHRLFVRRRSALARSGAHFIAVSQFVRDKLLALGFSDESVSVHYTGVDTDFFSCSERHLEEPHVLFVARIVPKKGLTHLLSAARMLLSQGISLRLTVVGEGPGLDMAKASSRDLPQVHFAGPRNPIEIRALMSRATAFCVPSITSLDGDTEGFGMVFAEAQSMGVPVVSFRSGGIPEAVEHGTTGFLANEGDTEALTHYLREVLNMSQDTWTTFSHNARQRVLTHFNLRTQTTALEELYDDQRRRFGTTSKRRFTTA